MSYYHPRAVHYPAAPGYGGMGSSFTEQSLLDDSKSFMCGWGPEDEKNVSADALARPRKPGRPKGSGQKSVKSVMKKKKKKTKKSVSRRKAPSRSGFSIVVAQNARRNNRTKNKSRRS